MPATWPERNFPRIPQSHPLPVAFSSSVPPQASPEAPTSRRGFIFSGYFFFGTYKSVTVPS